MNRLHEYDIYYVEWLHKGAWIADTVLMQKGVAPEAYCEERLKEPRVDQKTKEVLHYTAYILLPLQPPKDSGKVE